MTELIHFDNESVLQKHMSAIRKIVAVEPPPAYLDSFTLIPSVNKVQQRSQLRSLAPYSKIKNCIHKRTKEPLENKKRTSPSHTGAPALENALLLGYVLESWNQSTKILLGDLQTRFSGDTGERT